MKLSTFKKALEEISEVKFQLPNGEFVPNHFHVTEVGLVHKHFIDCGGTVRNETIINFQLFTATDYDHRLGVEKLQSILTISEQQLALTDMEIEVEYQSDTIGKYGLSFENGAFQLVPKFTDCLASDKCGIPQEKPKIRISANGPVCDPNSGCC